MSLLLSVLFYDINVPFSRFMDGYVDWVCSCSGRGGPAFWGYFDDVDDDHHLYCASRRRALRHEYDDDGIWIGEHFRPRGDFSC